MTKYVVRLLVVSVFVPAAGLALAQKRPLAKTESRAEAGKVASADEPDFTRFRVVTEQGILAVFDADEDWDGRDEPYSQLAYWNDYAGEQLYFFDQLLFTDADVLQSVATMQRDLQINSAQLLVEKPELGQLSEITSPGMWRIATEVDVLTVMAGANLGAAEEGGVSGLIAPCAPNPNCSPAAAAASSSIPAPVRGTPKNQLFVMAQSATYCNCGGGGNPPPPPPDPFRNIRAVADKLIAMEDDLLINHFDPTICPFTEVTDEVVASVNGANYSSTAPIKLKREGVEQRSGSVSVTTSDGSDTVGLQIVTTLDDGVVGPDPQWTLNQTMRLEGEELRFSGSIQVVEASGNSYTLAGGWTYSVADGAVFDPLSDAGFQDALINLQGFEVPVVAGGGLSPGEILSFISNVTTMILNYLRDLLYPFTAPTNCYGATLSDVVAGPGCPNGFPPCLLNIPSIALFIDELPDVSNAFKKCMKGRFACGQSFHPQASIKCDISSYPNCGPCILPSDAPATSDIDGCSLAGRHIWYCDETNILCVCVGTVFHEASHACGALDQLPHDANYSSYRIGYWFADRYQEINRKCIAGINAGQACTSSVECVGGACPSGICPR